MITIEVRRRAMALAILLSAAVRSAAADTVTDANERAARIVATIPLTPVAARAMALVQVSVHDAVQSIRGRHPAILATVTPAAEASVDAAVAAAARRALLSLVPAESTKVEADYAIALAGVPEGPARDEGLRVGDRIARDVIAARADDGAVAPNDYRPRTRPGSYVPTTLPVLPHWGRRRPWLMRSGSELRPAAPPALESAVWKRDLAESAELGSRASTRRTPEQTAIAQFWATTSPGIYWPLVRQVAEALGGGPEESSRLLARAAVAMDDAFIAVFEAKYAYGFWRPITAIRSAAAAPADSAWLPLIETPMHPEYPCAHCIVSAAVGAVLEQALGDRPCPPLRSSSPTATAGDRTWTRLEDFVSEVSEARIVAGVHYRHSTEVGRAMGKKVAGLLGRRFPEAR